jgi:hypothetical protein
MKIGSFLAALMLAAGVCSAQRPAFSVSAGYSNFHVSNTASSLNYERDGGYVDGDLSLLLPTTPRLIVGAGVSGSFRYKTEDFQSDSFTIVGNTSRVSLYSLEARIGMPISSRDSHGFFVLPRLGAGLLVSDYAIDTPNFTEFHTGAAFEVRPSLQAGYSWGRGSAGVEVSYMAAWGNFGNLGNHAQEFRAGAFLRFRF